MCGRYALIQLDEIKEHFDVIERRYNLVPNYNAAPTQAMPIVHSDGKDNHLELMQWGLIPSWSKEPRMKFSTINARAEGLEDKPTFRASFKRRRCIVPADGFYEWQRTADGKQPYYITLKSGELFGFAGLWDSWDSPDGSELHTYTIITTMANEMMKPIHDRMPVILERQYENPWLDPDIQDPLTLHSFLKPYDTDAMEAYPVSTSVNNVQTNEAGLIQPITSR
jgi:putative SOS response-associated peptidase YedK